MGYDEILQVAHVGSPNGFVELYIYIYVCVCVLTCSNDVPVANNNPTWGPTMAAQIFCGGLTVLTV